MTWRRVWWTAAAVAVLAIGATLAIAVPSLPAAKEEIPTTRVARGTLKLTVYATGDLRAGRSATLVSPPAGGLLRIVSLLPTGTAVKKDDVVVEFDPADQEYVLEQAKSDLAEAEQQIVKARSDSAAQAAQDQVDLLTARYDVRRAELDIAANEFVGAIDAQKNVLSLEEAKRRLAQLEQDVKSRSATNQAALAVQEEARNKALLAIQRAKTQIDSLVLKAPIDGVILVKENRDALMFGFPGMIIPEYRQGDSANSGRPIADVIENGRMELRAKINERDRDNLQTGEPAKVQIDALPGETFVARVGTLAGLASRGNFWESNTTRQFDVAFQFDKVDPRFRAGSSARLEIAGRELKDVLHVPRQSVFDKNGKSFVYLQTGDRFQQRDVKVTNWTESRAVITGVSEGDAIALIDPEIARRRTKAASSGPLPSAGGTPK
jgi:HlyD family secretion protein